MTPHLRFTLISLATALAATLPLAAQGNVVIKAGRVITITGEELKDAVIQIENGKIKAIGKGLETPWEAKVIDASKQVVMPTYVVAHTSFGMSSGNENMANVPYLTVQDAIDPSSRFFEEALRNGIGTIHVIPGDRTLLGGTGMVVKPFGKTVEEMAVRAHTGLKMSLLASGGSRMAQIHKMRRALEDIKTYEADFERRKKEFEQEKAAGATTKKEFDEKLDPKKKPVVDLLAGKARAYFYVPSTAELLEALRLIKQYKLDVVLVLGPRVHQAVKHLAAVDIPVVLDEAMEYREPDPDTEKEVSHCPAALLTKAGKEYALSIGAANMNHYPWWQMAAAIRNGVSRDTALRSMTIVPAKVLGLDKEIGSLEVGKTANLQILTGDPLAATSWVDTVLLDGQVVYERGKDLRLQHLFGANETTQPNNPK
ncbi:MAG: amidohydrolase family protein [Planctomycetes bacterium]|nr:amidohydrolase family protein [Planctomycetota bacterium]MCB9870041.1 amidohydrolase family protein [Planctomycetota bacterium]